MKNKTNTRLWKIILAVCMLLYGATILIVFFLISNIGSVYIQLQKQGFVDEKTELTLALQQPEPERTELLNQLEKEENIEFVIYNYNSKALVYGTIPIENELLLDDALNENVITNKGFFQVQGYDEDYLVWIAQYYISPQEVFDTWIIILLVIMMGLFLTLTAAIGIITYRLLRPMKRLQNNIFRLSSYQLQKISSDKSITEYDALSSELSKFADDLRERINKTEDTYTVLEHELQSKNEMLEYRTKMLAALAHDLKTPLHTAQIQLENLPNVVDKAANVAVAYDKIETTIENINNILQLTYADDLSELEKLESFDIISLFNEILEQYRVEIENKLFECEFEFDNQVLIFANPMQFKQLIQTAISNICEYASQGAFVEFACFIEDDHLYMSFYNDASPMPDADLAHVFSLFYRVASDKHGSGIGLFTSKTIVDRYEGDITFENYENGLKLSIRIALDMLSE